MTSGLTAEVARTDAFTVQQELLSSKFAYNALNPREKPNRTTLTADVTAEIAGSIEHIFLPSTSLALRHTVLTQMWLCKQSMCAEFFLSSPSSKSFASSRKSCLVVCFAQFTHPGAYADASTIAKNTFAEHGVGLLFLLLPRLHRNRSSWVFFHRQLVPPFFFGRCSALSRRSTREAQVPVLKFRAVWRAFPLGFV